jgi:Icc-related predicted phosphoesterase
VVALNDRGSVTACLFASDLHGSVDRYHKLFQAIEAERPDAVFLGGDLLPAGLAERRSWSPTTGDFVNDFLARQLRSLRAGLGDAYPRVFLILGNDDPRIEEAAVLDAATSGVWTYLHNARRPLGPYMVYGYSHVPPTPFRLKDWERYDVSRYVDPGCVAPTDGWLSFPVSHRELEWSTITEDLQDLVGDADLSNSVLLFHSPPYNSNLDRAALDGQYVDHVPLDVHVGSVAIGRFIEARQPLLTLHGHVHESARLTGEWRAQIGRTHAFTAAHDGPELALVRFDLEDLGGATRELL